MHSHEVKWQHCLVIEPYELCNCLLTQTHRILQSQYRLSYNLPKKNIIKHQNYCQKFVLFLTFKRKREIGGLKVGGMEDECEANLIFLSLLATLLMIKSNKK